MTQKIRRVPVAQGMTQKIRRVPVAQGMTQKIRRVPVAQMNKVGAVTRMTVTMTVAKVLMPIPTSKMTEKSLPASLNQMTTRMIKGLEVEVRTRTQTVRMAMRMALSGLLQGSAKHSRLWIRY
jgi:hypothetical protein